MRIYPGRLPDPARKVIDGKDARRVEEMLEAAESVRKKNGNHQAYFRALEILDRAGDPDGDFDVMDTGIDAPPRLVAAIRKSFNAVSLKPTIQLIASCTIIIMLLVLIRAFNRSRMPEDRDIVKAARGTPVMTQNRSADNGRETGVKETAPISVAVRETGAARAAIVIQQNEESGESILPDALPARADNQAADDTVSGHALSDKYLRDDEMRESQKRVPALPEMAFSLSRNGAESILNRAGRAGAGAFENPLHAGIAALVSDHDGGCRGVPGNAGSSMSNTTVFMVEMGCRQFTSLKRALSNYGVVSGEDMDGITSTVSDTLRFRLAVTVR